MVRIPQISSLETAIRLYYEKIELSVKDMAELFGELGSDRITKLKKMARDKMTENNIPMWNDYNVNTKAAYEAWGLDINDIEHRYSKLKKLLPEVMQCK